MRSTPRIRKTLAFVVAAATIAAACSSGDDTATDAGPALSVDRSSETTLRSEALGSQTPATTTEAVPDETTTTTDPADSEGLARTAPGLDTAGDSLFPGIGNGGYDIESYRISIDAADQTAFAIETEIELTATTDLSTFNLDLVGMDVVSVSVGGAAATFDREGRELIITPSSLLASGDRSTVIVTTNGRPEPTPDPASLESAAGWINESWGSYVASEPTGAATWFASNDHPTDKATFDIFVTVASGQIGAGPGILVDETANADGTTTFHWQSDDPMATYLASVVIGDFVIDTAESTSGTILRDVYPTSRADEIRTAMAGKHEAMLELFVEIFGPYPFDSYGVVGVPENLGYALENQTLSLFSADDLATDELFIDLILAHELAHQWFGNHVSPADWDDIWLNEGFATWAHLYWVGQQIETDPFDSVYADAQAIQLGPIKGLRPDELFALRVYDRGALTLEAIRRTIGDEAFFDLLQAWVERHGGSSATTQDFLDLVDELHGTDVQAIAEAWIFDEAVPELPAG